MNQADATELSVKLSSRAAKSVMRDLESLNPVQGQPLDYLDCLVIGLWRRLASLDETVAGLYAGADDFISKPFDLEEVVARIRVRLREHGQVTSD